MSVKEKLSLKKVMRNLNKEIKDIKVHTMKGFIKSAIIIRRDMEKTPPLIPVATGNLRLSWGTFPIYVMAMPTLKFGFSANYALTVHESYGRNFRRPGAGAGFFVGSIYRNKGKILNEIQKNAKV
jgi:hypothetical protein